MPNLEFHRDFLDEVAAGTFVEFFRIEFNTHQRRVNIERACGGSHVVALDFQDDGAACNLNSKNMHVQVDFLTAVV